MHTFLQPAFILHQRPYRETSLLVELFTEQHGRLSAVARGTRSKKSPTRAMLQPFIPLLLSWHGKGELVTLSSIEMNGVYLSLQGDCLLGGLYLNELLIRVLHKHDPYPFLYTIYRETLLELQGATLQQKVLRLFEKKLLKELGYELPFSAIQTDQFYCFHPERGFDHCHVTEGDAARIFSGKNLLAVANNELQDDEILRDAKRLMRLALAPLLGTQALQSRKLFVTY